MFQVPLYWGCIITMLDTFTFLFLDSYGRRKLEVRKILATLRKIPLSHKMIDQMFQFFFAFLIMVMAVSFGINYFVDVPDQVNNATGNAQFFNDRQM